MRAGVDVLVIDTAHGHTEAVARDRRSASSALFPAVDLVAGNVATAEGAEALVKAGADAIKVGHGAGVDLHDARRVGRRRAAAHRDRRRGRAGVAGRRPDHRRRRHQVTRATSRRRSPPARTP